MADPQNFVDNLKNLRVVMSVGLEHMQANRDAFITDSNYDQFLAFERLVGQIRTIAEQIEREFNTTEYLFAKSRRARTMNYVSDLGRPRTRCSLRLTLRYL